MTQFEVGGRVQVDISDTDDPNFDRYHGRTGDVVAILPEDADEASGAENEASLFEVAFSDEESGQFRECDLRPASAE